MRLILSIGQEFGVKPMFVTGSKAPRGLASVLVVDDEVITRSLLVSKFAQQNVKATEAEDGEQAIKILEAKAFDLAIVDLEMPNVDGYELLQIMRANPRTADMPVVVLSCREDKPAIDGAIAAGATSYMAKPIDWKTFGEHVARAMQGRFQRPAQLVRRAAQS